MFRGVRPIHAVVAVVAMLASAALGSSVVPMSTGEMADHAGQVITGDVTAIRSYWADEPRRIETEVTFARVEYLKGAHPGAGDTFTLRVPGGTIGELQMRIEGAPEFAVGETLVLFLLPTYKTFPVVGIEQGAFRVVRDAGGTERVFRGPVPAAGVDTAVTYDDFVTGLAPILAASRDHRLTEPAGRPTPVTHHAVPLRRAAPKRSVRP